MSKGISNPVPRLILTACCIGAVAQAHAALDATVYAGYSVDYGNNEIVLTGLATLGSFVDPNIDHWDGTSTYRWNPFGRDELYSVKWTGFLNTQTAGTYNFRVTADDGFQLFIDGNLVASYIAPQWYGVTTASAVLPAGSLPFEMRFNEQYVYDGIRLEWQAPEAPWEIIPAARFSQTAVPLPGAAWLLAPALVPLIRRRRK